nr:MAG TPA: hypothetical protein [Caudoviricetes sp.]DAT74575.1 MAG TPA: hypothetical protein [Bacteriophage sp.]DAX75633.1 MAG TPA: hypothetical protein [Caudoviricetes sp.]
MPVSDHNCSIRLLQRILHLLPYRFPLKKYHPEHM